MHGMFGCLKLDMQAMSEIICIAQDVVKIHPSEVLDS